MWKVDLKMNHNIFKLLKGIEKPLFFYIIKEYLYYIILYNLLYYNIKGIVQTFTTYLIDILISSTTTHSKYPCVIHLSKYTLGCSL